jgi:predicted membrane protein (TIGR00267 family)
MAEVVNPARRYHDVTDAHVHESRIAELILGGQDGTVNVLGVILGVAAATHETRIVVVAAVAAAIAQSVSMAAVAYTSTAAVGDRYLSELARERRHIERVPQIEREEIRALYARKGFSGALLERVVETITKDKEVWVAVMMAEEHNLHPIARRSSLRSAFVVGAASLVGAALPLVPFVLLPASIGAWAAVAFGALVLFAFGAYKARVTIGRPLKSGAELALIGTASALAAYAVGLALRVS